MAQLFSRNGVWMTLERVQELEKQDIPVEAPVEVVEAPVEKKPFCSQCDSKGVRHKKGCPLYK
jgi:hypothetical protein